MLLVGKLFRLTSLFNLQSSKIIPKQRNVLTVNNQIEVFLDTSQGDRMFRTVRLKSDFIFSSFAFAPLGFAASLAKNSLLNLRKLSYYSLNEMFLRWQYKTVTARRSFINFIARTNRPI